MWKHVEINIINYFPQPWQFVHCLNTLLMCQIPLFTLIFLFPTSFICFSNIYVKKQKGCLTKEKLKFVYYFLSKLVKYQKIQLIIYIFLHSNSNTNMGTVIVTLPQVRYHIFELILFYNITKIADSIWEIVTRLINDKE